MKKVLSIILAVSVLITMLVVVPLTANANEKEIAATGATSGTTGDCTWKIEGTTLTISGNGRMGYGEDIDRMFRAGNTSAYIKVFPWQGSDYTEEISDITEVIIEDGVNNIAQTAFYNCQNLKKITFGNSVMEFGKGSFYGCGITSVTIPDSVTWIPFATFAYCSNLTSVIIPDTVTDIFEGAFYECKCLTSIDIPDSVKEIDDNTFYNCTSLTSIDIPDSVTSIGGRAFSGCTSLRSVYIPSSVTSLQNKAFGYYYDPQLVADLKIDGFTIYGEKGSLAERYADVNGFSFVDINSTYDPTKTTDRDIFGDIDGDGVITIVDTTFLQRYTVGAPTPYPIGEKIQ